MSDNELLLAMSKMLEPMRVDICGIKNDMLEVKSDLQNVKIDLRNVKADLQGVKADLQEVKTRVQNVETGLQEVRDRVTRIELTQENNIIPRLQNIEACYTSTYDRYKVSVDDYETIKQDISVIKDVVMEHSEKLQKIS